MFLPERKRENGYNGTHCHMVSIGYNNNICSNAATKGNNNDLNEKKNNNKYSICHRQPNTFLQ